MRQRTTGFAVGLLVFARAILAAGGDPLNRDSPQSSVSAFLNACKAHDYGHAWRYIDLRGLPADKRVNQGQQLAQQLQQVLEHDARFDLANLSQNPAGDVQGANRELVDTFTVEGRRLDLQMERVTLRSGLQVWLFSAASIPLIPQLARRTSDSPIERHLPDPLVNWQVMNTALWRWMALVLLIAAVAVLAKLVSRFVLLWMAPALQRLAPRVSTNMLNLLLGPLQLILIVAGFRTGMEWIAPSAALRLCLDRATGLLFFSALAWLAMRLVDLFLIRVRAILSAKHQSFSYSVLPLASRGAKIVIVALTATAVLSIFGYNTATIVTGLGVGGVALALAAQKTVENLFGGVAVIADRPVTIGDFCRFGDQVGTVEDIGLRSTRIRTLDRTLLNVPNSLFSSMTLENFSKRDKLWFHLILNLRRDTTSSQVRRLLDSIGAMLAHHPKVEPSPLPVRFAGIGAYSLDLEVFIYLTTVDGDEFTRIKQELFLWILDEVEAAGTALALPYAVAAPAQGEPSPR